MNASLSYKGFIGTVHFSTDDRVFFGKIEGIDDLATFEGTTVDELEEAFQRKKKRELEQARMAGSGDAQTIQQVVRSGDKVGRNDPCPCGSGKKYKKCHGS